MTRPARRRRTAPFLRENEAGFTLVEALVAFMIVALALTIGMRVLAGGSLWARDAPAQAARSEEALSIVDGLVGAGNTRPGLIQGRFADGSPWQAEVTNVTDAVVPHAKSTLLRIELFAGDAMRRQPLFMTLAIEPRL